MTRILSQCDLSSLTLQAWKICTCTATNVSDVARVATDTSNKPRCGLPYSPNTHCLDTNISEIDFHTQDVSITLGFASFFLFLFFFLLFFFILLIWFSSFFFGEGVIHSHRSAVVSEEHKVQLFHTFNAEQVVHRSLEGKFKTAIYGAIWIHDKVNNSADVAAHTGAVVVECLPSCFLW